MNKVYLHINYFEKHYSLEEAFAFTSGLGAAGLEVRDRDRSGVVPLDQYLAETSRLSERFKLDVVYGCRVETTHPEAEGRGTSVSNFHRVLAHAQNHGCSLANVFTGILSQDGARYSTSGSFLASEENWKTDVEIIQAAADRFPDMTLAMETHSGYLHDLAAENRSFLDKVNRPNVLANLDYANIWLNRRGQSFDDSMHHLQGRIGYVHLKNARALPGQEEGDFIRTPLTDGDIDILHQLRALSAHGFAGPICLENTMKTDKLPVARADAAALHRWLSECATAS